jgi:hypothetical protein
MIDKVTYFNNLLNAVVVRLVLYGGARGEIEDPPEDVPDPVRHCRVVGGPIPDGQDVLLEPRKSVNQR